MKYPSLRTNITNRLTAYFFAIVLTVGPLTVLGGSASAAACTVPGTDYGKATATLTVPGTATYRIWTRMMVPDTTNKTYLLEIDGNQCFNVGGGSIAASSWKWIDYHSGSTSNKVQMSLNQGAHTIKLIGNAPGVKLDRVIAVSDLNCVPTGFGDNCDVPDDTTPPMITLTAPAEAATISGTVTLTATATDNIGVTKVEFYDNSSLIGNDTSSPYEVSWDSRSVPNDSHLITARAYDAADNASSDANTVSVRNGDTQAPSKPGNVQAVALSYKTVKVTWSPSTDNVAVTGYTVTRDGVPVADLGVVKEYTDTELAANTSYEYKVLAFDAAGNKSPLSSGAIVKTLAVDGDTQAPSKPAGLTATAASPTQVNLAWQPSTDNTGVVAYDIYRSTGNAAAKKIGTSTTTSFGDSAAEPKTNYMYSVVARDGAGNASPASDKAKVRTLAVSRQTARLTGTITNVKTKKPISFARVVVVIGGNRYIYQADKHGRYAAYNLDPGQYNFTFTARGYNSSTISTKVSGTTVQDVGLKKK